MAMNVQLYITASSALGGKGLCPLLLQLHHRMFSFLWDSAEMD